jgi:hypothetical protein
MSRNDAAHTWDETDLCNQLQAEFGDLLTPDFLMDIARQEVSGFEFARIRDFVPLIAYRQARARVIRHLRAQNVVEGPFRGNGHRRPVSAISHDAAGS